MTKEEAPRLEERRDTESPADRSRQSPAALGPSDTIPTQPNGPKGMPEKWLPRPVKSMGDVTTGKALAVNAPGAQRPYLRTKNVFDGRIDINDVLTMPMTDPEFERFRVLPGDVLLNERTESRTGRPLRGVSRRVRGNHARCRTSFCAFAHGPAFPRSLLRICFATRSRRAYSPVSRFRRPRSPTSARRA